MNKALEIYGWNNDWEKKYQEKSLEPARIGEVYQDRSTLFTCQGKEQGKYSGNLLTSILSQELEAPVTGDWVLCRRTEGSDFLIITQLLPRVNVYRRQASGPKIRIQNLAANLDYLFICTGLDGDFNPRRIERYLVTCWESGINPVVLLTKADLEEQIDQRLLEVEEQCPGTKALALSSISGRGIDLLENYLKPGKTIAMVGSSGCGKSTLLNYLMNRQIQTTQQVRSDDSRGRHTTTNRSMHLLPSGTILIDTPGLREVQLWDRGEDNQQNPFRDIEDLADGCHFHDCCHQHEPGCNVKKAIQKGELSNQRYQDYITYQEEIGMTREKRKEQKKKWGKEIAKFSKELKKDRKSQFE